MKELGLIVGVAESTISLYENGKRQPDNATLIRIAEYFGVSTDYLLGRDETPAETTADNELLALLNQMTEEEIIELTNYVDFIISKRK
jgi:transcriptional regulator with XRE-family HTH domain